MLSARNALLLVSILTAAGCRSETERLFAEAARAERADDYEGAARYLREIVIGHPESPFAAKAQLELAQIHLLRTRDVATAHAELVEILEGHPESEVTLETHRLLGRLYERELQDPERAIQHYRTVLRNEENPEAAREILLSLGECHYRLEELREAAAAYKRAVALPYGAPTDAAYFRLATLSRLAMDGEAALRWLEELASRTTDDARRYTALLGQVEALMSLGRYDHARDRLSEAERLSPDARENADLQARLDSAERGLGAMDGSSDSLLKLQEKIRWGSGRRER